MRKRRVYLILGFVGVVLAGVLVAVFSREREPEDGGERLSEWVEILGMARPGAATYEKGQCEKAIRQIGTNAILYLLKWIRYETPSWKSKIFGVVNPVLGRLNRSWQFSDERRQARALCAIHGLIALGSKAEGAVPSLARMMNDT